VTLRQAQVALLSFVLLAGGVTYNALYMQDDALGNRRTASETTSRPPEDLTRRAQVPPTGKASQADAGKRTAPKSNSGKSEVVTGALPDQVSADTIRSIQRELGVRGFGPVPSDGVLLPITRAAIMAYEYDHRLPLTGEATEALLARLTLGVPAASNASGAGEVRSAQAEAVIKQVQRLLVAHGYRPGSVDGRFGPETVAAIRAFEHDQGLAPAKGRVSAEVLTRLLESSAKLKAAAR
jgi:peptidoglycan hydrolase-like protein with peptidoglycan-binding domain